MAMRDMTLLSKEEKVFQLAWILAIPIIKVL